MMDGSSCLQTWILSPEGCDSLARDGQCCTNIMLTFGVASDVEMNVFGLSGICNLPCPFVPSAIPWSTVRGKAALAERGNKLFFVPKLNFGLRSDFPGRLHPELSGSQGSA